MYISEHKIREVARALSFEYSLPNEWHFTFAQHRWVITHKTLNIQLTPYSDVDLVPQELRLRRLARHGGLMTPMPSPDPIPTMFCANSLVVLSSAKLERSPGVPHPNYTAVGQQLNKLHSLPSSMFQALPAVDPIVDIRQDLTQGFLCSALEHELGNLEALAVDYEAILRRTRLTFIHGDASMDSLIPTSKGLIWSSFAHGGLGPYLIDLARIALDVRRFGLHPVHYNSALKAYGLTLCDQEKIDIERLVDILELREIARLHALNDESSRLTASWYARTLKEHRLWKSLHVRAA